MWTDALETSFGARVPLDRVAGAPLPLTPAGRSRGGGDGTDSEPVLALDVTVTTPAGAGTAERGGGGGGGGGQAAAAAADAVAARLLSLALLCDVSGEALEWRDAAGFSPLHVAATSGRLGCVRVLLQVGGRRAGGWAGGRRSVAAMPLAECCCVRRSFAFRTHL